MRTEFGAERRTAVKMTTQLRNNPRTYKNLLYDMI